MNTRQQCKRIYSWVGRAKSSDQQLKTSQYRRISIKSERSLTEMCIQLGEFVLVEGENADQPFVAKLLKLYEDGSQEKHAVVQWFSRITELPLNKRKLLQREVSPQEIFLDKAPGYDTDINVETIIKNVKVIPLAPKEAMPVRSNGKQIFFVKESWDGKCFKPLSPGSLSELKEAEKSKRVGSPSPLTDCQTSDLILSLKAETDRVTRSTVKTKNVQMEIESKHSASKSSLSKERHSQRVANGINTPGARKKLQLNSPTKSRNKLTGCDVLELLGDDCDALEPLEPSATKRKVTFTEILDSPPKISRTNGESDSPLTIRGDWSKLAETVRIAPYRRSQASNLKAKNLDGKDDDTWHLNGRNEEEETEERARESRKTTKQAATSKSNSKSNTNLAEEQELKTRSPVVIPRSHRKCVQKTTARIAEQLHFLNISEQDREDDYLPSTDCSDSSSNEEEESMVPCTPKRKMRSSTTLSTPKSLRKPSDITPAKTPRKTPEPRTPKTPRNATPRIPIRNQATEKPANVLEEARLRLHVSTIPGSLPCREEEFQDIYNFVESKLIDGTGGCMYISGVPGTGKTATVHEVIRCLQQAAENDGVPSFQFIEINGMKLTDPHQAYVQILQLLTGQKVTATHAAELLAKLFSTPGPKRKTTVLIVDELDLLWTRKQDVMYNLFDWPTQKQAKLIILAIANTMDLPERIMMNRVASRLGLTRMSFQPYTYKQLQQIISSRLNHIKAFEEDAIQLVSRKVAALSGDARRCLDICRRSTEICEFSSQKSASGLVSMAHVMKAIDEMFSSPYINSIRNASLHEQMFLKAIIAEFRRSGLEEATVQQIYHQHVALCRIEGLQIPTVSEIMAICSRLGACRFLLVESNNKYLHVRVRLNISQDDVMYALKQD
ncbi:origin recognition complex subunit 1 isoform X1 [Trachemys scripta elegans]|uniref:origin recognition complex subunit 1 isoform X1 n=1 Tax=Trachemys scripta elegans TaxID=31138 RepID=UPI0015537AD4|nr:origin recognition complex subunit 1 isoform X1 [Trachemys scripta elegans]XP_034635273.1 origin recognition complex subunit 1 isoform X1 [Trachemys scripta elegans]XP_034635274.1 origin recognition complex subunit 1 isoform X1 [Trachemys scripta elegans]XP_034635277.1 origin recognition complex subunit 1 isoform X1 [Trachemys scripta elegans]